MSHVSMIVAMDEKRVIGNGNKLPGWKTPGDLKRFKEITTGKVVIMGRKTLDSIGKPLPNRLNIVVSTTLPQHLDWTRNPMENGVFVARSLTQAFREAWNLAEQECYDPREVMVIGGAQIYEQALPQTDRLYLTQVKGEFEGDTFFPEFNKNEWNLVSQEDLPTHSYLTYERK